jgi:hypothetical protein
MKKVYLLSSFQEGHNVRSVDHNYIAFVYNYSKTQPSYLKEIQMKIHYAIIYCTL